MSACVVLAWCLLALMAAAGMRGPNYPAAQANTSTASNIQVILTSESVTAKTAAVTAHPAGRAATWTVQPGDTLTAIATELRVSGGWQALYAANRSVVGGNPDLILPGERLTWTAPATTAKPAAAEVTFATSIVHHTASSSTTSTSSSDKAASGFVAPISAHYVISEGYGVPGSWAAGHHTGVDLAVPVGTTVRAVGAGTVVKAEWGGAYGKMVVVRHADGRYSLYAHLSRIDVHVGEAVSAGTELGLSGATGNVTGPHLHFEVDTTEQYGSDINPITWLASHGVHLG